jgi:hypothetical protein
LVVRDQAVSEPGTIREDGCCKRVEIQDRSDMNPGVIVRRLGFLIAETGTDNLDDPSMPGVLLQLQIQLQVRRNSAI